MRFLVIAIALLFAPLLLSQQGYVPSAAQFDGANDWYVRISDFTGNSDGKLGLLSFWIKFDAAGDGVSQTILNNGSDFFQVERTTTNKLRIWGFNSVPTLILNIESTTAYTSADDWIHFMASWDMGNDAKFIYVDGSADLTVTTFNDDVIDYTPSSAPFWRIGTDIIPVDFVDGAISELYFAQEFLDLSVAANRAKFITVDNKPVDLGSSGYGPTGTVPILYSRTQREEFTNNAGTGGNFIHQGQITSTPGPVAIAQSIIHFRQLSHQGYFPFATDFDGTNDFLLRGGDLTGNADGQLGLVSFWFRVDGGDATTRYFLEAANGFFFVRYETNNKIGISAASAPATFVLNIDANTAVASGVAWHHFIASWDLSNDASHIYLDDVEDQAASPIRVNAGDIDYTRDNWGVGARQTSTNKFTGALSEFYFTTEFLDLSVTANRRKFIDANGEPVYLNTDGSFPTGTVPLIYLRDRFNGFGVNAGSGGNFGHNGAVTTTTGPKRE